MCRTSNNMKDPTTASTSATPKRNLASCTECKRRKQKCSREWPCNHCRSRKVSHLCNFGAAHIKRSLDTEDDTQSSIIQSVTDHDDGSEDVSIDQSIGQISFGYMTESGMDGAIADLSLEEELPSPDLVDALDPDDLRTAMDVIPPRSCADILVKDFVSNTNYQYYAIHPSTFLERYSQWWAARKHGHNLDPRFTCLLLRVCALAILYIDPIARSRIEEETGGQTQILANRCHRAAQRLGQNFPPGKGGLMHVQQLFLTATWLKAESMFVESWHILSSAVREAQEQGMHKAAPPGKFSDFEQEMRTRLWCILFTFDWQMSRGLGRPLIIDHTSCTAEAPNLLFDQSDDTRGLPSPFTPMALQWELVKRWSSKFGRSNESLPPSTVQKLLLEIRDWFSTFPPTLRMIDTDTSWDESHPWIIFQRRQLNIMGNLAKILPLKSYLTRSLNANSSAEEVFVCAEAVRCCIDLIKVSFDQFVNVKSMMLKHHAAAYAIFDAATVLCSALIHDRASHLPYRQEAIKAVGLAVDAMDRLRHRSALGIIPFRVISRLASIAGVQTGSKDNSAKRVKQNESESPLCYPHSIKLGDSPATYLSSATTQSYGSEPEATPEPFGNDEWLFTHNTTIQPEHEFWDFGEMFEGDNTFLEGVWDWQSLNIDPIDSKAPVMWQSVEPIQALVNPF